MKPLLIAIALLTLTMKCAIGAAPEAPGFSSFAATSAHREVFSKMLATPVAEGQFAQLATNGRAPISSSLVLTLVVVFVVALRLMGLSHARAMADHERSSYHGKAQMFRSLHEERTGSRSS